MSSRTLANPESLSDYRKQCHRALQWVALAARANISPRPDASHYSLQWDAELGAFVTDAFDAVTSMRFGFELEQYALCTLDGAGISDRFALADATNEQAGAWTNERLVASGLKEVSFADLPYALEPVAQVVSPQPARAALTAWFELANNILQASAQRYADIKPGPSPVRCWPHHFDLATLITLETGSPESARSVGVGLSPGDTTFAQPYFYVNPWPPKSIDAPKSLPDGGHWHSESFVGAVATAEELLACDNPGDVARTFVSESLASVVDALEAAAGR
ncbi:MAG: hypothetical protein K0U93_12340 [Gammaproteobacteria bacterium]|nr:hypothetical protein [Gammaproteobacteria bacterium]